MQFRCIPTSGILVQMGGDIIPHADRGSLLYPRGAVRYVAVWDLSLMGFHK